MIVRNEETYKSLYDKIQALIVIDVVEGTAMEALPYMETIVKSRPEFFEDIEAAIKYMYKSGTIKNADSARLSVSSLVILNEETGQYEWRTNLLKSKEYWHEWFTGLTHSFLSIRLPKLLMLAGSDRMDKELTIAHMQGKFKMCLINEVGHFMHEDNPHSAAMNIIDFVKMFRIPELFKEIKPIVGKLGGVSNKIVKYENYQYT